MKAIDAEIISKIQKLLNLSDTNRNGSIGEAETALAMAHKLLAKHHLSMSQIMALDESGSDNSEFFELQELEASTYVANVLPKWLKNLIETVNIITETRTLLKRSPRSNSSYGTLKIVYVGDLVDVTAAKDLFEFFRETVSKLANSHIKKHGNKFKLWRSFAEGCSLTLLNRAVILTSKNKEVDEIPNSKDSAEKLSVDNFEVDDDDLDEELDDFEDDEENEEEDDLNDDDDDEDEDIEIDPGCSLEVYKKYQDTKFEKIKEFINQLNVEEEQSSSRSSKVDVDSFGIGKKAGEQIPLKVITKLSSNKQKTKKQ